MEAPDAVVIGPSWLRRRRSSLRTTSQPHEALEGGDNGQVASAAGFSLPASAAAAG